MYIWETNLEVSEIISRIDKDSNGNKLTEMKIEGLNRVAVHTGYYACLNKIRQINKLKQISTKRGGENSHNKIIESLYQYKGISDSNRLVREMKRLKEYRRKADYDDGNSFLYTNNATNRILLSCKKTFEKLNKI